MKKLLAVLLAMLMTVALCSCGGNPVQEYVDENGDALLASMETSFATSSGMTCESSIEVDGNGIIISININELDNIDDSVKQQMQNAYDQMNSLFKAELKEMQTEVPELDYYEVRVCEKDGDLLAEIHIEE